RGGVERAAAGAGGQLADRAVAVPADHRRVVAAGDRDGDRLARRAAVAVGEGDVVALGQRLAGGEEIERAVGDREVPADRAGAAAGAVRPDRIEREGAEIAAGRGRDRRAVRVGEVEVGEADRARGGVERAAAGAGGQLADRAVAVPADHRRVVAAGDRDGDRLARRAAVAVGEGDVVALGQRLAGGEEIERAVGDREVPADRAGAAAGAVRPDRIEREGAEIAAGRGRDRRAVRVGEVEVGEADRARGGVERAAAGAGGQLADRAVAVPADHRRVVAAGDRDGDRLARRAAVAVGEGDVVALGQRLAGGEEIERAVGDREVPADRAGAAAGAVRPDRIEREGAEIAAGRGRDRRAVRVGEVEVGEADRARGGVERAAAGAGGQLADRAVAVPADHRRGGAARREEV